MSSVTSVSLPLTEAQLELWRHCAREHGSSVFNVAGYGDIHGPLDPTLWTAAVRQVVREAESLHVRFEVDGGEPRQVVVPGDVDVAIVDLTDSPDPRAAAERWMWTDIRTPFDLAEPMTPRCALLRLDDDRSLFYLCAHHIVSDGFTQGLLFRRVTDIYDANVAGRPAADGVLLPLSVLVEDDLAYRNGSEQYDKDRDMWAARFPTTPEITTLSDRGPSQADDVVRKSMALPRATAEALRAAAWAARVALPEVIIAATAAYVQRMTGTSEVLLTLLTTARKGAAVRKVPGMVANSLPLPVPFHREMTRSDLLRVASREIKQTVRHQRMRGQQVRYHMGLPGDTRLFGPTVNILGLGAERAFGGCVATVHELSTGLVDDIEFIAGEASGGDVLISVNANPLLYDEDEIAVHARRLARFLGDFAELAPELPLARIDVTPESAWQVAGWVRPEVRGADELLDSIRAAEPNSVAVIDGNVSWTYGALWGFASVVGAGLVDAGVGIGGVVGVLGEPGAGFIGSVLGVWGAGGAYVPLDPSVSVDRIAGMLADTGARWLLTFPEWAGRAEEIAAWLTGLHVIVVGESTARVGDFPSVSRRVDDAAYVLFTSGSTGRPKGVVVCDGGMVNHLWAKVEDLGLSGSDIVVQNAPLTFDVSVWQMFSALLVGGCVRVVDSALRSDPARLFEVVVAEGVTVVEVVPSVLRVALDDWGDVVSLPSLRWLLVTGEAFAPDLRLRWLSRFPGVGLVNAYGPTECSDDVTHGLVGAGVEVAEVVPIGRPVRNTRLFVLGPELRPVPAGVVGELYVAGVGVARGYAGRSALTAERFVANPFGPAGSRLYRTGDRVRWNRAGELECLGRVDSQVKIRGMRIELGEIEVVLRGRAGVKDAVVAVRPDPAGQLSLVGYVVGDLDVTRARIELGELLPSALVPSVLVEVDAIPVDRNGKVDRRALPEPMWPASTSGTSWVSEEILAGVFAEVLGLPRIGVDDSFFDLGGHSLLVSRVIGRVRAVFAVELPVTALFESPTVAGLARLIERADGSTRVPLRPGARPERIPLSYAQQRLWVLDQLGEGGAAYHVPTLVRLSVAADAVALRSALGDVIARHESLRTVFPAEDGTPYQHILSPEEAFERLRFEIVDAEPAEFVAERFDLAGVLPVRARLSRDGQTLLLVVHHIAGDALSWAPVWRDLSTAYAARIQGQLPEWAPLPVQYADYAVWQLETVDSVEFWREALAGAPDELNLPVDRARPSTLSLRGGRVPLSVDAESHRRVVELARQNGVTVFMVVQAALAVLLSRLGAGTDIPLGTAVAGRGEPVLEDLVGFFVNTVVLRTDLSGEPSFRELLSRVRDVDLAAFRHQDVPFELVVDAFSPARSLARNPLFQVMLVVRDQAGQRVDLAGVDAEIEQVATDTAKFDLLVDFGELTDDSGFPAGILGAVEYSSDLFDRITVERIADRLIRVLDTVTSEPESPVSGVDVLDSAERLKVLHDWNDTAHVVPSVTVPELFAAQVAATPDAVALVFDDQRVTYADLSARVDRMAGLLAGRGAAPERVVAIALPRSVELVVALLAVLKTGAAFLPIDPDYPADRVAYLLADANPVVTVSDTRLFRDGPWGRVGGPVNGDSAAYVLYTSGSTGRPKGVVVSHSALVNRLLWMRGRYQLPPSGRVLQKTSCGFDVSVWEFFWALTVGATLVVARPDGHRDPAYLAEVIRREGVTDVHFVPSMLREFLREPAAAECTGLRNVYCSGEALSPALWAEFRTRMGAELHNLYGPTEAAIDVTEWTSTDPMVDSVPIGKPVWNTRVFVLDDRLRPVPPGVAGELYLAGVQLARGYQSRSGLTAERFVANPFGAPGARMYRTGDRAKWNRAGEVEYLGRVDHQIKIRGVRVEPAEIEAVLAAHDSVSDAVVLPWGDQQLVAYVIGDCDPAALRSHAATQLPQYMVPTAIVPLDAFPVTTNGKLDRKALPAPVFEGSGGEPSTPREHVLCELFADTLGLDRVGVDDDFFQLGGHSLTATRLVNRIRSALGVDVSLQSVFETPTPAGLAFALAEFPLTRDGKLARPNRLPLSFAQQRLWVEHQIIGPSPTYNIPATVRLTGELDRAALAAALNDVVRRHESLRTVFAATDGVSHQVILQARERDLPTIEVTEDSLAAEIEAHARELFDLAVDIPFRCWLFALGPTEHVLLLVVHHVAGDGWSMDPLARDISQAYTARSQGQAPDWTPLPVQYADYALWQREDRAEDRDFWPTTLAGLPGEIPLPTDRPRPTTPSHEGDVVAFDFDATLHGQVAELAADTGTTEFMVVHAALAALLTRLGAGTDIPIGTPVAGRDDSALDDLIGLFVTTLVLRTDVSGDPTFRDLLDRVRQTDLTVLAHQHVPFERSQPFQVLLAFQNTVQPRVELPGLTAAIDPIGTGTTKFDLSFSLTPRPDRQGMRGYLEFSTDLFDRATAQAVADRFVRVLTQAVTCPDTTVGKIDILDADERRRALVDWNGRSRTLPSGTLTDLFEDRVILDAQHTAVTCEGAEISYRELDACANRLAHLLIAAGAGPERIVALLVPPTIPMVVALLAVLKSGAAYLNVDPGYPADRIAHLLADSAPTVVLTTSEVDVPAGLSRPVITLDDPETERRLADAPATAPTDADRTSPLRPDNAAYVVYTSGSTGTPKGVVVRHRNVIALVRDHVERFGLNEAPRVLQFAPLGFDAASGEILATLLSGALLILASARQRVPGEPLGRLVTESGANFVVLPPTVLATIPDDGLPTGITLVVAGEECPPELVDRWATGRRMVNAYGPTETTVTVTVTDAMAAGTRPTIGRPLDNTTAYVLDEWLQPVPAGVPGELYLGGAQVARGYLHWFALTASRFVADPFGPPGSRLYRSGDIAAWTAAGTLRYLGRADQQVKIRGFRVELGEVESVIATFPGVRQATAVVRDDRRLVGYVVGEADPRALREFLRTRLPDHMVPAAVVEVDAFPLTPNGKLDRAALPAPRFDAGTAAARTTAERVICDVLADVLGLPAVGVEDSFFDLGGDSITAIQVVSEVRKAGWLLTPRDVLLNRTPERMAEVAQPGTGVSTLPAVDPVGQIELTPIMAWLRAQGGPIDGFNQSVLVQTPVGLDLDTLRGKLQAVLDHHDALRMVLTVRPDGAWELTVRPPGSVRAEPLLTHVKGSADLAAYGERARAALAPEAGEMVRAVWFDAGPTERGRLLLVLHHLVVDGVSWRILLDDLAADELEPVGTSLRQWSRLLAEKTVPAKAKWLAIQREPEPPLGHRPLDPERDTMATAHRLRTELPVDGVTNEILLTALALAVVSGRRTGGRSLMVTLEGHGREQIVDGVDLSRTVGWFTTVYPVRLDPGPLGGTRPWTDRRALDDALRRVREQLPDDGIDYGLISRHAADEFATLPVPRLGFNYLGRFSAGTAGDWRVAPEPAPVAEADPGMPLPHVLSLNASVQDGPDGSHLVAEWTWAGKVLADQDAHDIAERWTAAVRALLARTAAAGAPAELAVAALAQDEIDELADGLDWEETP
jgi:amino acid adenylation domain-containing protein/non-ribosomal peptide synthase protein (TIGR01720 family)